MSEAMATPIRIKRLIVESLNLEGMRPEMIEDETPLFGEGLGLDPDGIAACFAKDISMPFGDNNGLEAGEFPLYAKIPLFIVVAIVTAQFRSNWELSAARAISVTARRGRRVKRGG